MKLFDAPDPAELPPVPSTGPYATADEELDDHLAVVAERLKLMRELAERAGTDPLAPVDGELRRREGDRIRELGRRAEARSQATARAGLVTPLARLRAAFELTPLEVEILVAALAPERSPAFRKAYSDSWSENHVQPEVVFYTRLLADGARSEHEVRYAFAPDGKLSTARLIEVSSPGTWLPEAPLLYRRVRVAERVVSFLEGQLPPPAKVLEGARFYPEPRASAGLLLDEDLRARVARSLQLPDAVTVLHGLSGVGRKTLCETVAAEVGRPMLAVDLGALPVEQTRPRLLELVREARLQGALLLFERGEVADDERRAGLAGELARVLVSTSVPRAVIAARVPRWLEAVGLRHVVFEVPVPPPQRQRELWLRLLPPSLRLAPGVDIDAIVRRYSLVPGAIEEACAELLRLDPVLDRKGVVDEAALAGAIRARLVHRLGALASPVSTTLTWDDLVLPNDVINRLVEFLSYARQRDHVLGSWGFGKKLSYGRGLSALFSGPPGTGKTMVATLLAQELGLELYRIDLAQVVNKYIGETEKNLGQVFDEARHGQVVLLFDEADSLFAKRTEVKSSHDRYANLEVNYLLQRMENFEGVMILTTNAETAIDPAFRRRIRFRIRFPAPDDKLRADLWRTMIPPEAALAPDVNFALLAKKYPLAGGSIKNAVVRAAVAAAEERTPITHAILMQAAALEYEEMGFLAQRTDDKE